MILNNGVQNFINLKSFSNYVDNLKELSIDLSLSTNPLGCSKKVLSALSNPQNVNLYPSSINLKKDLGKFLKIDPGSITLSSGSESLILSIPKALLNSDDEVLLPEVTFWIFEQGVILSGAKPVFIPMTPDLGINLKKIKRSVNKTTRLIILTTPNNPTGQILEKKSLIKFVKSVFPIPVIVDEANIEFAGETVVNEVTNLPNLIVLRTFSKGFGLAGLRIGFAVADPKLTAVFNKIAQPFPISSLSLLAASLALKDQQFIVKSRKLMNRERVFLSNELKELGFTVFPSLANNLLVKVTPNFKDSDQCVDKLAKVGVSVVNGTAFRGLRKDFIRLSPRTRIINTLFIEKLSKLLSSHHSS